METRDIDCGPMIIGVIASASPYDALRSRYREAIRELEPDAETSDADFIIGEDGETIFAEPVPVTPNAKGGGTGPLRPYMHGGTLPRQSTPPEPPPPAPAPDPNQKYRDANEEAEERSDEKTRQGIINKRKKAQQIRRRGG